MKELRAVNVDKHCFKVKVDNYIMPIDLQKKKGYVSIDILHFIK